MELNRQKVLGCFFLGLIFLFFFFFLCRNRTARLGEVAKMYCRTPGETGRDGSLLFSGGSTVKLCCVIQVVHYTPADMLEK